MKTFRVRGGDINLGPSGYEMATGETKVKQDLSFAFIEPLGNDRFYPRWGSLLPSYIGGAWSVESKTLIHAEINRVLANYRSQQMREIEKDTLAGRKSRFTDSEIIVSIDLVQVATKLDVVFVRVHFTTRAGQQVAIVHKAEG